MHYEDAFKQGVTPASFVEDFLPELYEPWAAELTKVSDVPLTVGLCLTGSGGGEWTLYLDEDELDVESGRGSTPVATLVGDATFWDVLRPELARLAGMLDASREEDHPALPPDRRLNDRRLGALERVSGEIVLTLEEVPGVGRPLEATVVLNGFEPGRSRALSVALSYGDLLQVVRGETTFKKLASAGQITVSGDVGLTMKLAGALL